MSGINGHPAGETPVYHQAGVTNLPFLIALGTVVLTGVRCLWRRGKGREESLATSWEAVTRVT